MTSHDHQPQHPSNLWDLHSPRLTETRRTKMLAVASHRTAFLRLVLQDVENEHNIAACLRSAEVFGIQHVDVVTKHRSKYKAACVAKGVGSWLTIRSFESVSECAETLKAEGFLLAAGMPRQNSKPLDEVPLTAPLAIVFGNEHSGVSSEWEPYMDLFFTIPMFGFVESLNISVSAAVTLHHLAFKAQKTVPGFYLSAAQQRELLGNWVANQYGLSTSTTD